MMGARMRSAIASPPLKKGGQGGFDAARHPESGRPPPHPPFFKGGSQGLP